MPKAPFSLPLCCVLLTYLLAAGCAVEDEGAAPAEDFPPLVLQEVDRMTELTFGSIASMALAEDGRLFVADGQTQQVVVIAADGERVETIGQRGQGPGEFQRLSDIRIIEGALYAHDTMARRTTRWALDDLATPALVTQPEGQAQHLIGHDGAASLWLHNPVTVVRSVAQAGTREQSQIIRLASNGPQDTLLAMPARDMFIVMTGEGTIFHALPFARSPQVYQRNRQLYTHWSGKARVEVYSLDMEPIDSVSVPFAGEPLTSTERSDLIDRDWPPASMRSTYRQVLRERIPDRWPATDHFFVDTDGRIWMGLNRRSLDETRWIVFDEERDPLGRIDLPNTIQLRAATGERVYGWLNDDEVGGPVVVRYVLDVPEG